MPKYKATFLVPAQVAVTVWVDGEGQQAGLVAAYDALNAAKPELAKVVSLDLQAADLTDFKREEQAEPVDNASPPSPLAIADNFVTVFHRGCDSKSPVLRRNLPQPYAQAKAAAETVLQEGSLAGYAEVRCAENKLKFFVAAPRGGWEVHATPRDPLRHRPVQQSWLEDGIKARATALDLFLTKRYESVVVFDYTDRETGPVAARVLR